MAARLAPLAFAVLALVFAACDSNDGSPTNEPGTLATVVERGVLRCGVNDSVPGFGFREPDGSYSGFDVDFCRAIAAAVLGDRNAVEFHPLTAANRFDALSSGEIDVLIRNTTWTTQHDAKLNAAFTVTTFYDGQGMMVRSESPVETLDDMSGATICVLEGTTSEANLADFLGAAGIPYDPLAFEDIEDLQAAFIEGRCEGWTSDKSQLVSRRAAFPADAGGPEAVRILGETFSREPLGPATREDDGEWFDVVNWVVIGMITADELGITSRNVAGAATNPASVEAARLLGVGFGGTEPIDLGLGLHPTFMQDVLAQVGNYDEVYQRNITPFGLPREGTLNDSWLHGGLIYGPPMR